MKMSKGLLLTIGAMLAIGAILSAACSAPPAPPPPAPPAQAPNQAPVISKVTANPSQIITGKSTTITAVAADPDDDPLTYKWSASQGTIEVPAAR